MAKLDLTQYGITGSTVIAHNPSYETLFAEETKAGLEGYDKGVNTELDAVNVMTGIYTGRSPKDKYIVKDAQSQDKVWWTSEEYKNDNHPMSEEVWAKVKEIAIKELCNKNLYVVDAFCGANAATRLSVRFIVEVAWQAHFVKNMFIQPTAEELESFEPNFVIYNADPKRLLIGDDEHGWDDEGVFNLEGGCYAKVINLSKENEPDIYGAIKRNALLENVTVAADGKIDFADKSVTENTRVSYPIDHIEKIAQKVNGKSAGPDAKNVIFLSADAFGVLPPVSILTPEQTKYYFLSGFTAKLAGTERGITEPTPTFSACFGQAFLELHPTKYAEELVKKMEKSGAKAYLVNTGWNGTGKRISIPDTRGIIDAILDGSILKAPTKKVPFFDFEVPTELPNVNPAILDPRDTYATAAEWEEKAKDLAARFIKNFKKYEGNEAGKALVAAGPKL